MSLSISTLSAIQKVGAAAFTADEKLRKEVRQYAERVHAAIAHNPYDLGNDNLIENWKVVARLSKTLAGIEGELKTVHQVASELTGDDQPSVREVPALEAPPRSAGKGAKKQSMTSAAVKVKLKQKASKPAKAVTLVGVTPIGSTKKKSASPSDLAPTDVLVKLRKKAAAPKVSKVPKAPKTKVSKPAVAGALEKTSAPGGNPAKLLAYLERTLNTNEFSAISQTAVGETAGIALGSMTAAIKKLIEGGRIIAGPAGSYKLADSQPTVAAL